MSHRFDDLCRLIVRKRDFDTKKKLVKMIRREIHDVHKEAIMKSVEVGFLCDKVVVIIECDYGNAVIIKDALKDNKITNHFDIRVKVDNTYPDSALLKAKAEQTITTDSPIANKVLIDNKNVPSSAPSILPSPIPNK